MQESNEHQRTYVEEKDAKQQKDESRAGARRGVRQGREAGIIKDLAQFVD
jgi:hypothetical protein